MTTKPPQELGQGEAERWFMRLQMSDCSCAERAAFARWRLADQAHAAAYAEVERMFSLAGQVGTDPRLQVAARVACGRIERRRRWRSVLRRSTALTAVASVVLVLGMGWRGWNPAQPEQRYATAIGESRALTLDDGSIVLLDTDSAVSVQYHRLRRDVVLERGQAQFEVAPHLGRPFVVQTGLGAVRALGTRFQVRKHVGHVEVALIEGVVEVTATSMGRPGRAARLAPGEQLDFDAGGRWVRHTFDPQRVQGWTEGQLVFRARPLGEVVGEMNRYNSAQIRIGQPSLNALHISGQFYSNDPGSLIQALEVGWSLRAERSSEDEIVLYRRD